MQAARPVFIADMTTAFSLFINCLSTIPAIFQFGLCGGVLIVINFLLVLVYMPALLVLDERGSLFLGRVCCLSPRAGRADTGHSTASLLHSVHAHLFNARRCQIFVFLCVVAALFPFAIKLFSSPGGGDFELFVDESEPLPPDITWHEEEVGCHVTST